MNELSPALAKQVLCRYNADGICMYGEACYFSHDRGSSQFHNICNFYLKGFCRYGEKCKFDHVKASKLQPQIAANCTSSTSNPPSNAKCSSSSPDKTLQPKKRLADFNSETNCILTNDNDVTVLDTSWAEAPEFVPSLQFAPPPTQTTCISYSQATKSHMYYHPYGANANILESEAIEDDENYQQFATAYPSEFIGVLPGPAEKCDQICTLHMDNGCYSGDTCPFIHGDQCPICSRNCLHPTDKESRDKHEMDCFLEQKDDIEMAFKISQSEKKVCGICMDVVFEKPSNQRVFGILSHCNHTFCLGCLRQWRCQKNYEKEVKRSCPECRVVSHFVTPSPYWVENENEKKELIESYKKTLSTKDCKYFDKGDGVCPFGKNCFYKHALSNGQLVPKENPRYQASSSGETRMMNPNTLQAFLLERENRGIDYFLDMDAEDFFIMAASLISLSDYEDFDDSDDISDDDSASSFSV